MIIALIGLMGQLWHCHTALTRIGHYAEYPIATVIPEESVGRFLKRRIDLARLRIREILLLFPLARWHGQVFRTLRQGVNDLGNL
jgi:hypothetical protein